jgi:AraC-like DNA-binding protein
MEMSERFYGSIDRSHATDQPFYAHLSLLRLGPMLATRHKSTLTRAARSLSNVAADGNDGFLIGLYSDGRALAHNQNGREVSSGSSGLSVLSFGEPGDLLIEPGRAWMHMNIPGAQLRELVARPDDMVARPLDGTLPAARYLRRYLDFLHGTDGLPYGDAAVEEHIATTLVDLVALCLGAGRDAAQLAKMRGLRAARFQLVLAEIDAGFSDPALSVATVAAKLGLSPRTIQDLLHNAGTSMTERVLELRLQKARQMLSDPRCDAMRVGEIAFACGFQEASYFSRSFRKRFGATPAEFRIRGG